MEPHEEAAAELPGPPPSQPDLDAVSASIDPPAAAEVDIAGPPSDTPDVDDPEDAVLVEPHPTDDVRERAIMRPPVVEAASAEVAAAPAAPRLPGAVGYGRLPTAPVVTSASEAAETEEDGEGWEPVERLAPAAHHSSLAPWALGLAIASLIASLLVGWMLPLGLIAIVVGIVSLRRPAESRSLAVWSIALALVSVAYSVGWLLWAGSQLGVIG